MSGLWDGKYSGAFVCIPERDSNRIGITRRISINCIKQFKCSGVGLGMYGIMEDYLYTSLYAPATTKELNDWDKERTGMHYILSAMQRYRGRVGLVWYSFGQWFEFVWDGI